MNLIFILQEFRRRRILIALVLLLSISAGAFVVYRITPGFPPHFKSRQYEVGVASVRVLVDTHNSIVADLNPSGAASLSIHAQLLGDLLASQTIRSSIASKVGVPLQDLAVVPPAISGAPPVPTPVATAAPLPADASTLTISVDSTLPLVSISAQAPSQARASALATGAVSALRDYLASVGTAQRIPAARQPVITSLGEVSGTTTKGPSRVFGAAAALVLFCLSCYLILFVSGVRRRMREAAALAEPPAPAVPIPSQPQPADQVAVAVRADSVAAAVANGSASASSLAVGNGHAPEQEHEPAPEHAPEPNRPAVRQPDRQQGPRGATALTTLLNRR
jgi:hypothetical protein